MGGEAGIEEDLPMSLNGEDSHDADAMGNGQSNFVGNLGMVLLALAVLFALFVMVAALTHGGA